MDKRRIGGTQIEITPVAMGCWPITGITSLDVTETQSLATLEAALDAGINFFDTAYCYGFDGESERMIAQALGHRRDDMVIATKGGIGWSEDRIQRFDARPETLQSQCEQSLQRLQTDRVELYYLHAPDPNIPLAESAGALSELKASGKVLSVGVSNLNCDQLEEFHAVCPIDAYQPYYNMLQREIEAAELPWCIDNGVSVVVYWPLLKGLLAGKLSRDHVFDERDGRRKYPMFQGDEYQKNQDFVDQLGMIATDCGHSVAELVINWTIQQHGVTAALCGAKRPDQIRQNAAAMTWTLSPEQLAAVDQAIKDRGEPVSRGAVT